MNISGKSQNKSARTQIKIAFVPLIINPGHRLLNRQGKNEIRCSAHFGTETVC